MRTLIVYKGSPNDILKYCSCDLEKHKLTFEGNEIEKALIIGKKLNVKDWVRDYIENYCKIHNQ
jgi:hypothetical protein